MEARVKRPVDQTGETNIGLAAGRRSVRLMDAEPVTAILGPTGKLEILIERQMA
jgi:hypothetical protein